MCSRKNVLLSRCAYVAIALFAIGCIVVRVVQVNASAASYPCEAHAIGESIALGGAFSEYKQENTDGYTLTVKDARLMSRDDYLNTYAADPDAYDSSFDATDGKSNSLLVLDIAIRNDKKVDDEKGYLDSLGWSVTPDSEKQRWMRVDTPLFNLSVPQLEGAFQLSVRQGTEFTIHVPFSTRLSEPFPASGAMQYRPELKPGSYQFIVTNVPVRHIVSFEVS